MSEKAFRPTASENHLISDVERATEIKRMVSPLCVGRPTNSSGNKMPSPTLPRRIIDLPQSTPITTSTLQRPQDTLTRWVLLRALKQTPGGSSQYDGSHPPHTLSQIRSHRGPSNKNLFDRRAPQIAFESTLSCSASPQKRGLAFRMRGY